MCNCVICKREEILKLGERTQLLFQLLQFTKTLLMFMIHIHVITLYHLLGLSLYSLPCRAITGHQLLSPFCSRMKCGNSSLEYQVVACKWHSIQACSCDQLSWKWSTVLNKHHFHNPSILEKMWTSPVENEVQYWISTIFIINPSWRQCGPKF
jgi:hypothetical protein